jgi:tetratricopeptide (TPR) repeat protein
MPRTLRLYTALPLRWFLPLLLLSHAGALRGQEAVAPLLQHAREYEAQQRYDAAEEQYKQALEISPDNPEILKRLGILYQTEVKLQDSLAVFEKVLALQPQYPQTNFFMGVSYFALNDYESAITAFDKELATPHPHPKCRYYLALALESQGRIDEAIKQLDQLVRENPKEADALYELARIHKNASLRATQMLHDLDPDSYQLHALMGEIDADDERYPEAIHEYRAALAKRPDAPGIHYALGVAYWVQKLLAEAQSEFMLALKEDSGNAMTNLYLGDIAVKQGRFNEALGYLQQAEAGQPRMEQVHLLLGKCYHGLNQPDKAKDELLKAAEEDPLDPLPHYLLAQLYRESNDSDSSSREMAIFEKLSNSANTKKLGELQHTMTDAPEEPH